MYIMDVVNLIRDLIITTVLAVCAERIINRIKKWWYSEEDIAINDLHIDFIPEKTEDETILITQVGHNPKVFEYFSDVE